MIAALALAAAVTIPLLVRARGRRRAWASSLSASAAQVAWFARDLIPQLTRAGSVSEIAGGWTVSRAHVQAADDRLTSLEASALDDVGRDHARTLRDAVRAASARLDSLTTEPDIVAARNELSTAAQELEDALASAAAQPSSRGSDSITEPTA